jgi:hypothetical protein
LVNYEINHYNLIWGEGGEQINLDLKKYIH